MSIELVPLSVTDALTVVARVHRTHRPPQGGLWAVGLAEDGAVIGAAIVDLQEGADDPRLLEFDRIASEGLG